MFFARNGQGPKGYVFWDKSSKVSKLSYFWTKRAITFFEHSGEAVLRKHLRRKLRIFEETQINNIIRRAKGKRTCHDPLPVVISPVAAAPQDLVEAGDKAEVIIIKLRNFDKLT